MFTDQIFLQLDSFLCQVRIRGFRISPVSPQKSQDDQSCYTRWKLPTEAPKGRWRYQMAKTELNNSDSIECQIQYSFPVANNISRIGDMGLPLVMFLEGSHSDNFPIW